MVKALEMSLGHKSSDITTYYSEAELRELGETSQGHRVSAWTVGNLLKEAGYSLQSNRET